MDKTRTTQTQAIRAVAQSAFSGSRNFEDLRAHAARLSGVELTRKSLAFGSGLLSCLECSGERMVAREQQNFAKGSEVSRGGKLRPRLAQLCEGFRAVPPYRCSTGRGKL